MIENYINQVINGDCVEVMSQMPEGSIDLIVTSPPYGVNIAYDTHDDDMYFWEYKAFSRQWLEEAFRVLKDDGRIALNIPYESMDADDNSKLCDRVEALLNTVNYPILILEDIENITYLYRVDDSTNLGKHTITDTVSKYGCLDVNQMAQELSLILN